MASPSIPHSINLSGMSGQSLLDTVVAFYLLPGNRIVQWAGTTSWGRDLTHTKPAWLAASLVALLFWCVAISLLALAQLRVRQFLSRNER